MNLWSSFRVLRHNWRRSVCAATSWAEVVVDGAGRVDLASAVPVAGSYDEAETMGLIWSLLPTDPAGGPPEGALFLFPDETQVDFRVESLTGVPLATDTLAIRSFDHQRTNKVVVTGQPFVGTYYQPRHGHHRHPAILVISGSDGGSASPNDRAAMYSAHGFATLAVQYFTAPALPANLDRIPLEYFAGALDWLAAQPQVDPERIFVSGLSKGAEAALLLGATYPERIKAVVAYSPSAFAWQGIIPPTFTPVQSSWTESGVDVPYVPYAFLPDDFAVLPVALKPIFERSMEAYGATSASAAAIPVENIAGPVLLVSGNDDVLWPADTFIDLLQERFATHEFPHEVETLEYDGLGHPIWVPSQPTGTQYGFPYLLGGNTLANGRATRDAWEHTLCFLRDAAER